MTHLLQTVLITILNSFKYIETNALLDTGSDVISIKSGIPNKIGLNSDSKNLRITSAISKTSTLEWKEVRFIIRISP